MLSTIILFSRACLIYIQVMKLILKIYNLFFPIPLDTFQKQLFFLSLGIVLAVKMCDMSYLMLSNSISTFLEKYQNTQIFKFNG